MAKTVRVAILGGGMGGVAAAWALVHDAPPGVTYDVTIYEASWRLGGKCASGRNTGQGNRIEEHGIHILMGFYSQVL
ncbi:MAG TPA: FAD-dependent oxidoreductase, partial [Polyangiaceae bacterium]